MENVRKAKILYCKSGGHGGTTNRITLPVGWVRDIGCTEEDREVVITIRGNEIIIKKVD